VHDAERVGHNTGALARSETALRQQRQPGPAVRAAEFAHAGAAQPARVSATRRTASVACFGQGPQLDALRFGGLRVVVGDLG